MKVCFVGTVEFSKKTLIRLLEIGVDVCGVITNSQNKINSDYADLIPICLAHEIDFVDTNDINSSEVFDWLSDKNPDVIFCFGWSQLITNRILKLPQMGVIGFHPTLLPHNRGRHPIIWALALGLDKTGSTFFFMDEGADSGDILSQSEMIIYPEDDAKSLYDRMVETALKQIVVFIPQLIKQTYTKTKQENSSANTWRKRGIDDGEIDFRMTSGAIHNLVRALTEPYVGAHVRYGDSFITVWKVSQIEYKQSNLEPGLVLKVYDNSVIVKTSDGAISLDKHEFKDLPSVGEYL